MTLSSSRPPLPPVTTATATVPFLPPLLIYPCHSLLLRHSTGQEAVPHPLSPPQPSHLHLFSLHHTWVQHHCSARHVAAVDWRNKMALVRWMYHMWLFIYLLQLSHLDTRISVSSVKRLLNEVFNKTRNHNKKCILICTFKTFFFFFLDSLSFWGHKEECKYKFKIYITVSCQVLDALLPTLKLIAQFLSMKEKIYRISLSNSGNRAILVARHFCQTIY